MSPCMEASTQLFVLMMDRVMKHAVHTETHLKPPPYKHTAHTSVRKPLYTQYIVSIGLCLTHMAVNSVAALQLYI